SRLLRRPSARPLFPYTTLFRSRPYSPSSRLNIFTPAPGAPVGPPTPSLQRLHPGLPGYLIPFAPLGFVPDRRIRSSATPSPLVRSEEHTSELQSRVDLVCRLLL